VSLKKHKNAQGGMPRIKSGVSMTLVLRFIFIVNMARIKKTGTGAKKANVPAEGVNKEQTLARSYFLS
jgi:hypothetical protein